MSIRASNYKKGITFTELKYFYIENTINPLTEIDLRQIEILVNI